MTVGEGYLTPVHQVRTDKVLWKDGTSGAGTLRLDHSLHGLRLLLGGVAMGLALLYSWPGRAAVHDIDVVSYLDMGDAYMRGDWHTAINGLWSPLYALVLGGVWRVARPSALWEVPLVHLVGFTIYVIALLGFDFLWAEFGHVLRNRSSSEQEKWAVFPQQAWLLLGYSLFLWVSLFLIRVTEESPDMLVAAAVYVASGLLLRISRNQAQMGTFLALGLTLGLGYYAKTVLFPLSFVFLAVAAFVTCRKRQSRLRPLVSLLVFLLIASPLLVILSRAKGRFTFGDSGRINYIWHVDGVPRMYWQGDYPGSGTPTHPPRLIHTNPAIYEFGGSFAATFPPWYEPSYWYDGMKAHFGLRKQVRALIEAAGIYHGLFFKPGAVLITVSIILLLLRGSVRELAGRLDVLIPAIAAFGLYALVHVEPRYIGSFILVFWGGVLCMLRLPKSELASRLLRFSALAIVIIYSTEICLGLLGAVSTEKDLTAGTQKHQQVAEGIRSAGIQPGDRVATIGGMSATVWARLAKVRIVADMPDDANFWSEDRDSRAMAIHAFGTTGAKAIVAYGVPFSVSREGWMRIGQTEYSLLMLQTSDSRF
jgi:hypothetical protein